MKTSDVKALVREVLLTIDQPYSEHIIDEVFYAIEHNPGWRLEYESLCSKLGKSVVNTWGGYWTANALDKLGEVQVPSKKSTLIGSYSILDTDAKPVVARPKEPEALHIMADYYLRNKEQLSPRVREHRDLIVELLMEGMSPEEAFAMVLKHV